jgi:pilus assembly protein TadC
MSTGWGSVLGTLLVALAGAVAVGLWTDARGRWQRFGLIGHSRADRRRRTPSAITTEAQGARTALILELIAAILDSGASLPRAMTVAADAFRLGDTAIARAGAAMALGVTWAEAWPPATDEDRLACVLRRGLSFAATTGAPSARLISAHARLLRRERHRELERRAATLGVRLVIPLGVCSLPAFICLGVVPVLLSLAPS